uniref:Uncharacterized protein n=1 Tax=Monodon monoceros TaxID=40151 RepID=A0A8C6BZ52_MONMO
CGAQNLHSRGWTSVLLCVSIIWGFANAKASRLQEGSSVNWQVGPCYQGGKDFIPSLVRSKVAEGLGNTPGLIIVF